MKLIRQLLWKLYLAFFLYSLLAYSLCFFWQISDFWLAGFIMMPIPLTIGLHLISLLFFAYTGKKNGLFVSLFALLLSTPFWSRTIGTHWGSDSSEMEAGTNLKIISYNTYFFNSKLLPDHQNVPVQIDWIERQNADIVCFQETIQNIDLPYQQICQKMKKIGFRYFSYPHKKVNQEPDRAMGLVIFSKYPILKSDYHSFISHNGILSSDLLIGRDTITVVNAHLYSMTLRLKEIAQQPNRQLAKGKLKESFRRMKKGFILRNKEIGQVDSVLTEAKHPVLFCADLNETPYSYPYNNLRNRLSNSFEKAGKGLGFTYNQTPSFIRIDNQFYDPRGFEILRYITGTDLPYSDHYPIVAEYKIKGNNP